MRSFTDLEGDTWQAALLDASYGNIVLVFNRLSGHDMRQLLLDAINLADAEQRMATWTEADLRELHTQASAWDGQSDPRLG